MGLFAFAKEAPKLISDVIGVDSGKMKLGIGGKLAAGGLLGAAAFLGGGVRSGINNFTGGIKRAGANWKAVGEARGLNGFKAFGRAIGSSTFGLVGSTFAGTTSGAFRSVPDGFKSKNGKDAMAAMTKGFEGAMEAKTKRATYVANHGGFWGAMGGHIADATKATGTWMGIMPDLKTLQALQSKANETQASRKAIDDELMSILTKNKDKMETANAIKVQDENGNIVGTYYNYGTLLNELEIMKSTGKMSNGTTIATADLITRMNRAEYDLKERMKKEILEGFDLLNKAGHGVGHQFNADEFKELYDGKLQSLITDYRTKSLRNARTISEFADTSITAVANALNEFNQQAVKNQSKALYDFVSNKDVTKLFEDSKKAVTSATSRIDNEVNKKYQEASKKESK